MRLRSLVFWPPQGLAAGLMMSISFFDLFPESVEAVGEVSATLWFFAGAAFFALIVTFIPEPDSSGMVLDVEEDVQVASQPVAASTPSAVQQESGGAVRRSSRARR